MKTNKNEHLMKKILLAVAAVCATFVAEAQIIKNNLLAGIEIGNAIEANAYGDKTDAIYTEGWSGGYTSKPVEGSKSPVAAAPLTYAGYNEGGNSIQLGSAFGEGIRGRRASVYSLTSGKEYRKGALYLSFLIQIEKVATPNPSEVAALSSGYVGGGNRGTFYIARDEMDRSKVRFGVSLIKEVAMAPELYDMKQTYLIVIKVDYNTQQASLFINPNLAGEEPEAVAVANVGDSELKHAIRAISFRDRNSYRGRIGNFRLAQSWEALAE